MKKVKYEVTTPFANENPGSILTAYKICNDYGDDDKVLIYHPKEENSKFAWGGHGCSSLEFCKLSKSGNYISTGENSFINLTPQADSIFKKKIAANIKKENKKNLEKGLLKIKNILKKMDLE